MVFITFLETFKVIEKISISSKNNDAEKSETLLQEIIKLIQFLCLNRSKELLGTYPNFRKTSLLLLWVVFFLIMSRMRSHGLFVFSQ